MPAISRRRLIAGSAALALGQRAISSPSVAQGATKLLVATANAATDVPFWIAHKNGSYKDAGLDVEFTIFPSAARMIAAFASGELDVGGGAPSAALYNAVGRGVGIKMVADKSKTLPGRGTQKLIVRRDLIDSGRYKTLADLKGMKVGNAARGAAASTVIYKFLAKGGLKPADIEEVFLGFPDMVPALANKVIDAALPAEPSASQAVRTANCAIVGNDFDVWPGHQIAVVLYPAGFIRNKPEAAKRFLTAYLRGVRFFNDAAPDGVFTGAKGDQTVAILAEYGPFKDPAVYRSFTIGFCDPSGAMDVPSLEGDLDIFRSQGLIETPVTVAQAMDTSYLEAALKELGPYQRG